MRPGLPKLATTFRQRRMLRFLTYDAAFFLALFAVYCYLRWSAREWAGALHFASAIMAMAMSLFTFSATFTMAAAANAQQKDDAPLAARLLAATVGVLVMFLICDAMEWARLLFFEKPPVVFAETFCVLTGYHALHLIAALPYLTMQALHIDKSDIGASALLIHFTNAMWLILFIAFYMFGTDLQGL